MSISELISLIQAVTAVLFIVAFVWIVIILRKHPGSELEFDAKNLKGKVSIEDAKWMIVERLVSVSNEERKALADFNNERRTPNTEQLGALSSDVLKALLAHGLVKPDLDPTTGKESYRLALWGYRLLKNFLGESSVHQPWEWLSDEDKARIRPIRA